jgi:HSP20 family protein
MNISARDTFFDLDTFFNGAYQPVTRSKAQSAYSPRVDIIEQADSYQLIAELAGVSKENISVTVKDAVLTIEANNKPAVDSDTKVLRRERQFGQFVRSFKVGKGIEQESIAASFKDGLLYLTVPKAKPAEATSRTIEIH